MFVSGGRAVHYSSGVARIGWAGGSHGCVNIKDYNTVRTVYVQDLGRARPRQARRHPVRLGDTVTWIEAPAIG